MKPNKAAMPPHYPGMPGVWVVFPDQPIPRQFIDVLASWPLVRLHPAWFGDPQLTAKSR